MAGRRCGFQPRHIFLCLCFALLYTPILTLPNPNSTGGGRTNTLELVKSEKTLTTKQGGSSTLMPPSNERMKSNTTVQEETTSSTNYSSDTHQAIHADAIAENTSIIIDKILNNSTKASLPPVNTSIQLPPVNTSIQLPPVNNTETPSGKGIITGNAVTTAAGKFLPAFPKPGSSQGVDNQNGQAANIQPNPTDLTQGTKVVDQSQNAPNANGKAATLGFIEDSKQQPVAVNPKEEASNTNPNNSPGNDRGNALGAAEPPITVQKPFPADEPSGHQYTNNNPANDNRKMVDPANPKEEASNPNPNNSPGNDRGNALGAVETRQKIQSGDTNIPIDSNPRPVAAWDYPQRTDENSIITGNAVTTAAGKLLPAFQKPGSSQGVDNQNGQAANIQPNPTDLTQGTKVVDQSQNAPNANGKAATLGFIEDSKQQPVAVNPKEEASNTNPNNSPGNDRGNALGAAEPRFRGVPKPFPADVPSGHQYTNNNPANDNRKMVAAANPKEEASNPNPNNSPVNNGNDRGNALGAVETRQKIQSGDTNIPIDSNPRPGAAGDYPQRTDENSPAIPAHPAPLSRTEPQRTTVGRLGPPGLDMSKKPLQEFNSTDNEAGKQPLGASQKSIEKVNMRGPAPPSSGHFMAYFITAIVFVVIGYLAVHNKQKIMGMLIEGRGGGDRSRRRTTSSSSSSTAEYRQLKNNVEEAIGQGLDKSPTTQNYIY